MGNPFTDSFFRAVADYAVRFPNQVSLGTDAAAWIAEYNRVSGTAFAAVLLTANSQDGGGSVTGQKNFSQEIRADALHCRRYDLDNSYVLPPHLADYPSAVATRQRGNRPRVLRFSP